MTSEKRPGIERWREGLTPDAVEHPVAWPPSPDAPGRRDGPSSSPSSTKKERKKRRVFFHHPSIYPILVRIRNMMWVYAIMTIVGMLFISPATSMEKHMSILEDSNIVFRNIWWTIVSGPIQREYWRRDRRKGLDRWVETERKVAWDRMLRNIGPISGASDGLVIASPSAGWRVDEPDYYYTWTRDAALTMSTLVSAHLSEKYEHPWVYSAPESRNSSEVSKPLVEPLVRAFIAAQSQMQTKVNPSGDLWTGGLNEPKFQVDGSRFDEDWGRPQRDGPALRALTLIPYAHYLLDRGWPADNDYVRTHLYRTDELRHEGSVIKNDLEEVGGGWWMPSFDLWEEVEGHHMFTLMACLRALQAGAVLARRLEDPKAATYYESQAERLTGILPAFWNEQGYWQSTAHIEALTIETEQEERKWLDCALPLSIIHHGSDGLLSPVDSESLASLRRYILSFDGLYPLNIPAGKNAGTRWSEWFRNSGPMEGSADWTEGWAVGRYAEDVYNGIGISRGNPWHICTYSVAHVLYLAKEGFEHQGYIPLNNLTRPFWADLLGSTFTHDENSEVWLEGETKGMFSTALRRLGEVGDKFMAVGERHAPDGQMSEQIDRHDGSPVGARDLTWSYASFLEAARARERAGL